MNIKLKSLVIGSMFSFMVPTVLMAADVNDNYNTAVVEKWVNDSSNTAVNLLDVMTCMGGAGGISRPGLRIKAGLLLLMK